jgi:hypothetical protein
MAFKSPFWTEERAKQLLALDAEGKTSVVIAQEIGSTKGAVISKLASLRGRRPKAAPKPSVEKRQRPVSDAPKPFGKARPTPVTDAGAPAPASRFVCWDALDLGTDCKFPIGDPKEDFEGLRYCGAPQAPESRSWCAWHFDLCFPTRGQRYQRRVA